MRRDYRIGLSFMGPVTLAASGLAILSAKLYDYAFRRIDYVPDASADKQQYAEKYFEYVKWYQEVPSSTWSLNQGDPENYIVAKYIPADRPSKKVLSLRTVTRATAKPWQTLPKCFMTGATTCWCPMIADMVLVLENTLILAGLIDSIMFNGHN